MNPFMPMSAMGPVPLFLETTADDKKKGDAASPSMLGMGSMYGYGGMPMFGAGYPAQMSPYGVPSAKDTQKMLDAQAGFIKKAASLPMGGYMGGGMGGMGGMGTMGDSPMTGGMNYPTQFNTYSPFGAANVGSMHPHHHGGMGMGMGMGGMGMGMGGMHG